MLFACFLAADSFVLEQKDSYIPSDAIAYINDIGDELKTKTGVNSYIYASLSISPTSYEDKKNELLKQVKSPYVLLFFAQKEKKINILTDLKDLDRDDIYWDSIAPYIPKKDKLTQNHITGMLLNGYSAIALSIAEKKKVKLTNEVLSKSGFYDKIGSYLVMTMLGTLIAVFLFVYTRRKPAQ